jgi:predicted hotdog family 3-hydroxylacyl-ACP dehydratase
VAAFPPISSLIPHAGPSCLLEAVIHSDGERTECSAQIDVGHPYLRGQRVHSLLAIELFAQSAAVHRALQGQTGRRVVSGGRLVGANVHLHTPHFLPPMRLLVRVTPKVALGRLHSFSGHLYLSEATGVLLAEGDVSVAVHDSSPGFDGSTTEATRA